MNVVIAALQSLEIHHRQPTTAPQLDREPRIDYGVERSSEDREVERMLAYAKLDVRQFRD